MPADSVARRAAAGRSAAAAAPHGLRRLAGGQRAALAALPSAGGRLAVGDGGRPHPLLPPTSARHHAVHPAQSVSSVMCVCIWGGGGGVR